MTEQRRACRNHTDNELYQSTAILCTVCIVLTKTFAVETSTFLSVFHCYVIAQKFAQSCVILFSLAAVVIVMGFS